MFLLLDFKFVCNYTFRPPPSLFPPDCFQRQHAEEHRKGMLRQNHDQGERFRKGREGRPERRPDAARGRWTSARPGHRQHHGKREESRGAGRLAPALSEAAPKWNLPCVCFTFLWKPVIHAKYLFRFATFWNKESRRPRIKTTFGRCSWESWPGSTGLSGKMTTGRQQHLSLMHGEGCHRGGGKGGRVAVHFAESVAALLCLQDPASMAEHRTTKHHQHHPLHKVWRCRPHLVWLQIHQVRAASNFHVYLSFWSDR